MTRPIVAGLIACCAAIAAGPAPALKVVVRNPGPALGETPVLAALGREVEPGIYGLTAKDGSHTRAEVFVDGKTLHLSAVFAALPPGESEYDAAGPIRIKGFPSVQLERKGVSVDVNLHREPFTTLVQDQGAKPFLFPMIGPTGKPITRAFPMKDVPGEDRDHPHQRSFWFTHGKVNGVDFWTEQGPHGTIVPTGEPYLRSGFTMGFVRTRDDWKGPTGAKILEDQRTIRVFATKATRILDCEFTLTASEGPVEFGETKEGMFGLRVASSMDANRKPGGKITNAEGITDKDTWGKRSAWVDYVGPVEGETVGITILDHPENLRHPTAWHVRDYGLFAANPFGNKDFGLEGPGEFTLPAGQSLTFRYRVILHRGDTASAKPDEAFRLYADPPKVEVR